MRLVKHHHHLAVFRFLRIYSSEHRIMCSKTDFFFIFKMSKFPPPFFFGWVELQTRGTDKHLVQNQCNIRSTCKAISVSWPKTKQYSTISANANI